MTTEERFEVKPYGVLLRCDCGGEIVADGGSMDLTNPMSPLFSHKCRTCSAQFNLPEKYPTIRFERA